MFLSTLINHEVSLKSQTKSLRASPKRPLIGQIFIFCLSFPLVENYGEDVIGPFFPPHEGRDRKIQAKVLTL